MKDSALKEFVKHTLVLCKNREEFVRAFRGIVPEEEMPATHDVAVVAREVLKGLRDDDRLEAFEALVHKLDSSHPASSEVKAMNGLLVDMVRRRKHGVNVKGIGNLIPISPFAHRKKAMLFLGGSYPQEGKKPPETSLALLEVGSAIKAHDSSFRLAQKIAALAKIHGTATTGSLRTRMDHDAQCVMDVSKVAGEVQEIVTDLIMIAGESVEIRDLNSTGSSTDYGFLKIVLNCKMCGLPFGGLVLDRLIANIHEFADLYSQYYDVAITKAPTLFKAIDELCRTASDLVFPLEQMVEKHFKHADGIVEHWKSSRHQLDAFIALFRSPSSISPSSIPPSLWKLEPAIK